MSNPITISGEVLEAIFEASSKDKGINGSVVMPASTKPIISTDNSYILTPIVITPKDKRCPNPRNAIYHLKY